MTRHKHFKQLVRARMEKTGERYAAARRHVLASQPAAAAAPFFAGSVPATTALRSVLASRGMKDPATDQPFSEAMLFGLAGGVGIGVFSFLYEKADFASFFVGGRHLWHDDEAYLKTALGRLSIPTDIRETGSAKAAERDLRELLERGPCIAWVDQGLLPHRAVGNEMVGGGYYVVTVHELDADGNAVIGDLADRPIAVRADDLQAARGRIKKYRHRLLSIAETPKTTDVAVAFASGLGACHDGLLGEGAVEKSRRNFTLNALDDWAKDLVGTGAKSWSHRFPRGHRLWAGLTMLYEFVELAGTGGGLCRSLFADGLDEAASRTGEDHLADLASGYRALGEAWSELAVAALPGREGPLANARELMTERAELRASAPDEIGRINAIGQELERIAAESARAFPLDESRCADLRQELSTRLRTIHSEEVRLHQMMAAFAGREAA